METEAVVSSTTEQSGKQTGYVDPQDAPAWLKPEENTTIAAGITRIEGLRG